MSQNLTSSRDPPTHERQCSFTASVLVMSLVSSSSLIVFPVVFKNLNVCIAATLGVFSSFFRHLYTSDVVCFFCSGSTTRTLGASMLSGSTDAQYSDSAMSISRRSRKSSCANRSAGVILVGTTGFEPATPASRTLCSTRLSHVPTHLPCISFV
jgi:hypothetical protein